MKALEYNLWLAQNPEITMGMNDNELIDEYLKYKLRIRLINNHAATIKQADEFLQRDDLIGENRRHIIERRNLAQKRLERLKKNL